jgi:tRNA (guanine37-N1)-methyltransferase
LRHWTNYQQLVLICGAYEGFDERIRYLADREISLGDFVLTSGEIPALAIINGVMRLLPGTLGNAASLSSESFNESLLEYPQYTRPAEFRGWQVPEVLRSGNHQAIAAWRAAQQRQRTQSRRPDLQP